MMTKESLGIFWNGEELDGVLLYGFWSGDHPASPSFPAASWPSDVDVKMQKLFGASWTVWMWEIRLRSWPSKESWVELISNTLETFLAAGAGVAWGAVEGCFVEPPHLFDPEEMNLGVWTCKSQGGVFWACPGLEAEMKYVSEGVLVALRSEILRMIGTGNASRQG